MRAATVGEMPMRFGVILVGVSSAGLLLAGCDAGGGSGTLVSGESAKQAAATQAVTTTPDSAFDYRYAFSLPAGRIEAVQESHARGCDQLGPARCRITAMRYNRDAQNGIVAVLALKIDPTLARAFGKAAAQTVTGAHGTLTDSDIAGADSITASGRADTVVVRLRDALSNAEAQLRAATTDDQKTQATARAERLKSAIATIGEVDQGAGTSVATAPVLLTYNAGSAISAIGGAPDATFDAAGDTFLSSLAGLLVVLAGVGPWAVLLLGGALGLRWVLARTERAEAPVLPPAPPADHDAGRNVIQRWFNRDEAKEREPVE